LLAELSFELWIGDAAAISRKRVRKQKTDKQDAKLLLKLLIAGGDCADRKGAQGRLKHKSAIA
jgi:hypothetical protein